MWSTTFCSTFCIHRQPSLSHGTHSSSLSPCAKYNYAAESLTVPSNRERARVGMHLTFLYNTTQHRRDYTAQKLSTHRIFVLAAGGVVIQGHQHVEIAAAGSSCKHACLAHTNAIPTNFGKTAGRARTHGAEYTSTVTSPRSTHHDGSCRTPPREPLVALRVCNERRAPA